MSVGAVALPKINQRKINPVLDILTLSFKLLSSGLPLVRLSQFFGLKWQKVSFSVKITKCQFCQIKFTKFVNFKFFI